MFQDTGLELSQLVKDIFFKRNRKIIEPPHEFQHISVVIIYQKMRNITFYLLGKLINSQVTAVSCISYLQQLS